MAKRPTRLRFTEDDLSSDAVKKAAGKAEKAAAKAEKAVDKITPKKHRKLRQEADVSASRTAKLRFGKAKADDIPPKPSGIKRTVTHAPVDTLSANVHKSISRYEDDNVGVQTAHQTELGAETAYHIADHAVYSHKLKAYDKAEKLVSKSDKANVNTREEVQAELVRLFEEQYDLELDEEVEIRSYTTTDEDGNTSTVYYEYRILNVTLTNYGLGNVIASSRLTAEQWERYKVLLETLGNRSYLFGEDVSSAPGGGGEYTDYDIPGEALTDTAFANMVREAEKYLGYPYVWGGSSPSTSFDCSGFVSWVINNCGNGWSVGRQTANGLKNLCDIIPPSEAKPGDLIFFQGTYNTSGASHVGIYVGNGMMIHCGDPISYASIETNYWQQHFYCFGRIP